MPLKCVIGPSVVVSDARSCLARSKDRPIKANKQNKLLPDPVSQNTEEVLGESGHSLTANLFDGPVLDQEYIMLSPLLNTNA